MRPDVAVEMADPALVATVPVVRGRPTVLETLALTKVYRMGQVQVHALRGVDFHLSAGEFLVLLELGKAGLDASPHADVRGQFGVRDHRFLETSRLLP